MHRFSCYNSKFLRGLCPELPRYSAPPKNPTSLGTPALPVPRSGLNRPQCLLAVDATGSVTLNGVTNRNRWKPRSVILHRGTYWWTVLGDHTAGHPDLLLGHRTKCLYLHYLCKQLTSGHQICIVGASDRSATTAWDLTYFLGSQGSKWTKTFWDNHGGTNRNQFTQRLIILYVQTH